MNQTEEIPFVLEQEDETWVIRVYGIPTLAEIDRIVQQMNAAEVRHRLWIVESAVDIGESDIRDLAMLGTNYDFAARKSAVVCPHDLTYGMGRMLENYAEAHGRRNLRVFRGEAAARAWLNGVQSE